MPTEHTVVEGECISSIAFAHGFFPDTLWNHADNSALKSLRKDPNVLLVGDVVVIPDKERKEVSKPVEARARFRLKGVPAKLKLQILYKGEPRANEPYELLIGAVRRYGTTDGDGFVSEPLPPDAVEGTLTVGRGRKQQVFALRFGGIDPIETEQGLTGRLRNLGYGAGDDLHGAIKKFQADNDLQPTGEADEATRNKLKELFGQ